jgi:hypothetical protein
MSEDKDPTSDRGLPAPEPGHSAGSAEGKPESHATNGAAHSHDDLIAKLKRGLAETRLPAELRGKSSPKCRHLRNRNDSIGNSRKTEAFHPSNSSLHWASRLSPICEPLERSQTALPSCLLGTVPKGNEAFARTGSTF